MRLNVIIIEEDSYYADKLAVIVDQTEPFSVVHRFRCLTNALTNIKRYSPVIVIVGKCGDHHQRISSISLFKKYFPSLKIIAIVQDSDQPYLLKLVQSGVSGTFSEHANHQVIAQKLRIIERGSPAFDFDVLVTLIETMRPNHDGSLTPREQDVLQQLSLGKTYSMICHDLKFTRGSLTKHISSLYKKLGVHNRVDALRQARELRYLVY